MKPSPLLKKIITGIIIIGLVYGGYAYFFKKSSTSTAFTTVTTTVKKGDIQNTVQVIGVSALVYEQKMQFSQIGKVAKIFFKEGERVKRGQIMAELDTTDVLNDIKQQQVNLNNAQTKLVQTLKGADAKDILNAENTITSTKSRIVTLENDKINILRGRENKQTEYENQILSKQNDLTSKLSQLVNAQNELITLEKTQTKEFLDVGTDRTKTLDSAIINARKQIIDAETSLYSADEILGMTDANRTKNDSYEVYLSAKNSSLRTQAENDWNKATVLLSSTKSLLGALPSENIDSTSTRNLLSALSELEDILITLWKDGTDAVNASIASSSFSQSSIDSYANIFRSITSSSQSNLSAIKTTLASIDTLTDPVLEQAVNENAIRAKKQSISDQENVIAQSRRDILKLENDKQYSSDTYDSQLSSKSIDIENTKNTLKYNEESLALLRAGATKEEIILARNSVASQRISLEKVKEGIKKYQLEAPFDGVLRKIDFKLGDNIVTGSNATPEYIYIENPNLVEITATVDQLDVVKLKLSQDAKIVFDPFPTITFTGKVSDINSTPAQTSGVTSYTIKITLDKGDHPIFSGMSAKVDIVIESKEDTLFVGTSFVQKGRNGNGPSSVLKRIGTTDKKTNVTLGISTPTNTEILEGVSEWDTLVRKISTGTGATSNSLIRLPSWGGTRDPSGGSSGGSFSR